MPLVKAYADFVAHAPASLPRAEHDEWFAEHDYNIEDLLRVGRELAEIRLGGLKDGARLSGDDLTLALVSVFLFGVEMTIRVEREEATS